MSPVELIAAGLFGWPGLAVLLVAVLVIVHRRQERAERALVGRMPAAVERELEPLRAARARAAVRAGRSHGA